jgi:hypothetical protein
MPANTLTASGNVTNTGTAMLTTAQKADSTGNITLQAVITKVSGTVAGTAKPQGSLDGTNWFDITLTGIIPTQTAFTLTDVASQTCAFFLRNVKCLYYRILITGSGTMVATPTGFYTEDAA